MMVVFLIAWSALFLGLVAIGAVLGICFPIAQQIVYVALAPLSIIGMICVVLRRLK
jgi:hypothetical protein